MGLTGKVLSYNSFTRFSDVFETPSSAKPLAGGQINFLICLICLHFLNQGWYC